MSKYGPSRELGSIQFESNPRCRCSAMQAMFCAFGHMLECHYPHTCREAQCDHYLRQMENERDE